MCCVQSFFSHQFMLMIDNILHLDIESLKDESPTLNVWWIYYLNVAGTPVKYTNVQVNRSYNEFLDIAPILPPLEEMEAKPSLKSGAERFGAGCVGGTKTRLWGILFPSKHSRSISTWTACAKSNEIRGDQNEGIIISCLGTLKT